MNNLFDTLFKTGIVPVLTIPAPEQAANLARALAAGGIPIAEVTFRVAGAAEAIRRIRAEVPEVLVGAGTVINAQIAAEAIAAGAQFVVSPGLNPAVVQHCQAAGVPIIPGVNNPSSIEAALELGLDRLKFFPAEPSGGAAMLSALSAPFPQVTFMPTGGISLKNLASYAKIPSVHAIGGSWMAPAGALANADWDSIRRLSSEASAAVHGFAFAHLGINSDNEAQAQTAANLFAGLGLPLDQRSASIFASPEIELLKSPGRGSKGHIALKVHSVERALAFLADRGLSVVEESKKEKAGQLQVAYLEPEVLGFALHLLRA